MCIAENALLPFFPFQLISLAQLLVSTWRRRRRVVSFTVEPPIVLILRICRHQNSRFSATRMHREGQIQKTLGAWTWFATKKILKLKLNF